MKRFLLLSCFFLLQPSDSRAIALDDSMPITYSRADIIINRKQAGASHDDIMPWQNDPNNARLVYDVEVRDASTLYQKSGWYNLSAPSERQGVLLQFAEPSMSPIGHSAQYAPLDILFINKEGTIMQIVPNITLSNLDEEIYPQSEVLAFLFLKGGASKIESIAPGDDVVYKIFKKPPTVLGTSAPAKASETEKTEPPKQTESTPATTTR